MTTKTFDYPVSVFSYIVIYSQHMKIKDILLTMTMFVLTGHKANIA